MNMNSDTPIKVTPIIGGIRSLVETCKPERESVKAISHLRIAIDMIHNYIGDGFIGSKMHIELKQALSDIEGDKP